MTGKPSTAAENLREFAAERAHRDAQAMQEAWRAAANAAILINGGAATGVLTLIGSGYKASPSALVLNASHLLPKFASAALVSYAIGVACGTATYLFMAFALQRFAIRWEYEKNGVALPTERWRVGTRNWLDSWWKWPHKYFPDGNEGRGDNLNQNEQSQQLELERAFNSAIRFQLYSRKAIVFSLLAFFVGMILLASAT